MSPSARTGEQRPSLAVPADRPEQWPGERVSRLLNDVQMLTVMRGRRESTDAMCDNVLTTL